MQLIVSRNKIPQPYDTMKSVVGMISVPNEYEDIEKPLWKMKRFRSQGPRVSSQWTKKQERAWMRKYQEAPDCDIKMHRY